MAKKSRGADAPANPAKEVDTSSERFLNLGKEVTLSFGTYTVRELSFRDLTKVLLEAADVFMSISQMGDGDGLKMFVQAMSDDRIYGTILNIFAKFCRVPEDEFQSDKVSATDGLKILVAIKEVVDFEEIKKLFFALGLDKYIPVAITANRK